MLNTKVKHPALYGLEPVSLIKRGRFLLEVRTAMAFERLQRGAKDADIDLQICSAFRSFSKQAEIWNDKAAGRRPLFDESGNAIEVSTLDANGIIDAILLWSALPGASRHHFGTDMDVYDGNRIPREELQLIPQEYRDKGPCAKLHDWLLEHGAGYGFYFPYQKGLSGVRPEPWHLSYYPVARDLLAQYDEQALAKIIDSSKSQDGEEIALKADILPRIPALVKEYVLRIAPFPQVS